MRTPVRHRNSSRVLAVAALATLLSACASTGPRVHSDYDKNVDFNAYRTFGFPATTGTDRGGYATLVTGYFKEAVRREMTARGYEFAAESPDLLVNFYSEARNKTEIYSNPMSSFAMTFGYAPLYHPRGYRYAYPYYGWYSPWPFFESDIDVVNYQSGTLKLDVVDAKRQQSIWEARVEEPISEQAQNNPQPYIDRLVTSMFGKFPRSRSGIGSSDEPQ